jgi:subtilisin family serine protease
MLKLAVVSLATSIVIAGCTQSGSEQGKTDLPTLTKPENNKTPVVIGGDLPTANEDGKIVFPGGQYITVEMHNGAAYIPFEGVILDSDFAKLSAYAKLVSQSKAEETARMNEHLDLIVKGIEQAIALTDVKTYPSVGYFRALIPYESYEGLAAIDNLPYGLMVGPVLTTPFDARIARPLDAAAKEVLKDPRMDSSGYSGLGSMRVLQFATRLKQEYGIVADGSSVKLGITDTGITYNHPTFFDARKQNRIIYMRDFTAEGKVYFHPQAAFQVRVPTPEEKVHGIQEGTQLVVERAQLIPPSRGNAYPPADVFEEISGVPLIVSKELGDLILTPGTPVKLGMIAEAAYGQDEGLDINQNGKGADFLPVLLVYAQGEYKAYIDLTGQMDFRKAKPMRDWSTTRDSQRVVSEVFGLDVRSEVLKSQAGVDTEVMSIAVVGIDPGFHGSHVAGIAAGGKLISNDIDDTTARGVAPNAQVMMNRVCSNNGGCNSTEAIIDLAMNGAEIINMSLGSLSPLNDGYSVEETVIDRLTVTEDVLFVIAAGNSGPGANTVGSPSTARMAISVGASANSAMIERQYQWPAKGRGEVGTLDRSDDEDFMLFFSSRGPTAAGGFKPEITAPGTQLSAVPLDPVFGQRAGLDVMWGTSMASPAASGAIAILLDAAKKYNQINSVKLPTDPTTLKKVVLGSARPFDVTSFNTATGEIRNGQYTWIDQGMGMIDLNRAWDALVAERDSKIPSGVYLEKDGIRVDVSLDYQVRTLRTGPNGIAYDGTMELPPEEMAATGPRFGRGIWLDFNAKDSSIPVQIARRLPIDTSDADVGELHRLLVTSKNEFELVTTIYGSQKPWVRAGTMEHIECKDSEIAPRVTVVGEGAVDGPSTSTAGLDSTLFICIDRSILETLPPGDHGAVVAGYLSDGAKREANPSFLVPVYVTVPQRSMVGGARYEVNGTVDSFGVSRHYVQVPTGTSMLKVTVEVPPAKIEGGDVSACSSVQLMVLEGDNLSEPSEVAGAASVAANCTPRGEPSEARFITFTRTNPRPGIWNMHVFGRFRQPLSTYKMTVEYANIAISQTSIEGAPEVMNGELNFDVTESSLPIEPNQATSFFSLNGFTQTVTSNVTAGKAVDVPDADGAVYRIYPADVGMVSFSTGDSAGNDIDLEVYECLTDTPDQCRMVGTSAGSTDIEETLVAPKTGLFYYATVRGFTMPKGTAFSLTEKRYLTNGEFGTLSIEEHGEGNYQIAYQFDVEGSAVLKHPMITSGKYQAIGDLRIADAEGTPLANIAVRVGL